MTLLENKSLLVEVPVLNVRKVELKNLLTEFNNKKILNNIKYKKSFEWSKSKQQRYVNDLLIGLPVNLTIILNNLSLTESEVLEGYNRLIAVKNFLEGNLLIYGYDNKELINYTESKHLNFYEGNCMCEISKEIYSRNLNSN